VVAEPTSPHAPSTPAFAATSPAFEAQVTGVPVIEGPATQGLGSVLVPPRQPSRRGWRRPRTIVTAGLVVLVLAIGGGIFAVWQNNQGKYYLGVHGDDVAIYQGGSLYQDTSVPVAKLGSRQAAALEATVSTPSLSVAQSSVHDIEAEVSQCQAAWNTLADWKSQNDAYQTKLAAYRTALAHLNKRQHVPAAPTPPGPQPPTPSANNCAGAAAFGITPSELPAGVSG
jgi:hypothetical protein